MSRFSPGRPSAGMIVAAIALVIALTGTAIAGPDAISNKITKSKVKKIANKEIDKAAPGLSVKSADSAKIADSAKSADKAKIASNIYSAMVRNDGLMLGSIPDGATSSRVGVGTYRVNFGRDITGCVISASIAGVSPQARSVAQAFVVDSTHVGVHTDSVLDPTSAVDRGFYVQMICPPG